MSKRDEVIQKMKAQLDEVNANLDQLEKKANSGQQQLGQKYEEQVAQLRSYSHDVRKKLDEMKAAGDDRWKEVAGEAEKVQKALVHSFNYFRSQLK